VKSRGITFGSGTSYTILELETRLRFGLIQELKCPIGNKINSSGRTVKILITNSRKNGVMLLICTNTYLNVYVILHYPLL